MTSSVTSSTRQAVAAYVAGRLKAEHLAATVAQTYYAGRKRGDWLRPLVDVIERAHPGIVALASSGDRPGFSVQLAERPFPKEHEAALRRAAEAVLESGTAAAEPTAPPAGWLSRMVTAVRRLFSASA